MNKVDIWPFAHNDGENLFRGDCFENALWEELESSKKYTPNKHFQLLFDKLEELKGNRSPQDILEILFHENVNIDFEFAKQLKLYDIICPDCFYSQTDIGQALIYLLNFASLRFVVSVKEWHATNHMTVEFEMAHWDYVKKLHKELIKGECDY